MKRFYKYLMLFLVPVVLFSCSSDDSADKDEEKPEITVKYNDGFPQACAELARGETYHFKAMVTDNIELASYSVDIHNNFDHHTHDDQGAQCELDPVKESVNPMIFMENHSIEGSLTSYEIDMEISIPEDVDVGDYHCQYSVTDQTGWQSRTSIDIKIVE
ncbi:DUF4625 domain-containing protein [Galbibacter sp. PAP.153]|uniref:DUF4625 domain-containing protein n=1 Tax=Galbibacter sp. PAP.153 TaxID=3104623 RepID=UPI00300BC164